VKINWIGERRDSKEGLGATLFETVRKSLILKRRDVGVVDRARLENDFGEVHGDI